MIVRFEIKMIVLVTWRNLAACPLDVKESAYKGLVRPILEYGSSV